MAKYKEIVSMVLDALKITSDDSTFTEEHVLFLAGRYRSFLLKQRYYTDLKKQIPESNYQTLCLSLEKAEAIDGLPCFGGYYLRTTEPVPDLLPFGSTRFYTAASYFRGDITVVSKDRFKYVGENKYMQNILYATLGPDSHVYLNSSNPQFLYLEGKDKLKVTGIFEDSEKASELECDNQDSENCDILDRNFPIEDALVAPLIELIVKALSASVVAPEDKQNDANDNLSPQSQVK